MSRQSIDLLTLSFVASGAVTKCRAVSYSGAQATVAGQKVAGVALESALGGQDLPVRTKGTAIIETGGAIAVEDAVCVDATGRAVVASNLAVANPTLNAGVVAVTSSAANGAIVTQGAITGGILPQYVLGDALQAANGAGEFIEIALR